MQSQNQKDCPLFDQPIPILQKFDNQEIPNITPWLQSENNSVVQFALKLAKIYNQFDVINELLTENTEAIKDKLNENLNKAQNLQEEFKEIKKMMLDKKQISWEDKARAEDF